MAFDEPLSYAVLMGGVSETDLLQAWHNHFDGTSTFYDVVNASGTDGDAGFTIEQAGGGFQVNFRPVGGDIDIMLDPQGTITDPTNPAASASSDASPEISSTVSGAAADTTMHFHEWDHYLAFGQVDDSATPFGWIEWIVAGLGIKPFNDSDLDEGFEGYTLAAGNPSFGQAAGIYGTSGNQSYVKTGDGQWQLGQAHATTFTSGELGIGGKTKLINRLCMLDGEPGERIIGVFRHFFAWDVAQDPGSQAEAPSGTPTDRCFFLETSGTDFTLHPQEFAFDPTTKL